MGDALKDIYTSDFLLDFGKKLRTAYKDIHPEQFAAAVQMSPWEELPLRARMHRIAETLGEYLPQRFEAALEVLFAIAKECNGFPYLFFPDFVTTYGLNEEYWELSMNALMRFTQYSSSEFAIRPFIIRNPQRVMKYMLEWSVHPNEHVRRFSSEGCRPRLPWGIALPMFKKDPTPVLEVLENLKADSSLYVRKSVANNLNDIAKDNPQVVLSTAKKWIGKNPDTDWILRQGCRTLVRKAEPEAMALFGYANVNKKKPLFKNAVLTVQPDNISIGENCELNYSVDMNLNTKARIRIEYGIDFVKANGKASRKLFRLSDKTIEGKTHLSGTCIHSFANLTTRKHYAGIHRIVLLVNGQEAAQTTLSLQ